MPFSHPDERVALRRAAREVFDLASHHWSPGVVAMHEQWLHDLDEWRDGPPPTPPAGWAQEDNRR